MLGKPLEVLSFQEGLDGLESYLRQAHALPLRDYVPLINDSVNEYNDWIGAQIRADLYGWVCPGRPALAAELARRDVSLSHRGEGLHGAAFIAGFSELRLEDLVARTVSVARDIEDGRAA